MKKKFYEQNWFMWITLVFFAPIGIFLLWRYNRYNKNMRILLSTIFGIFFLVAVVINKQAPSKETLDSQPKKEIALKTIQTQNDQNQPIPQSNGKPLSDDEQKTNLQMFNSTFISTFEKYTKLRNNLSTDLSLGKVNDIIDTLDNLRNITSKNAGKSLTVQVDEKYISDFNKVSDSLTFLSASIFELKDALQTTGDYKQSQLNNSQKDYDKVVPYYNQLKHN